MNAARSVGRPKGGGLTADKSRAMLIAAAESCFARTGLDRATVDDIVSEAGVSRSTFYRHFASRDEVLTAVIARMTDEYTAMLGDRLEEYESLEDFTIEAIAAVVELVRGDPAMIATFSDGGRAAASRVIGTSDEIKGRARLFVRQILQRAGPTRRSELRPGLSPDAAADHLVLIGLALIQGFGSVSDDGAELRAYLREFVVPVLVGSSGIER